MFPPVPSSKNDSGGGSDTPSGGTGGKAALMVKKLATKAAKTVEKHHQAWGTRYYQTLPAIRDAEGKIVRRRKPGTVSLATLRWYQKSVGMLIPMLPFSRLVREVADDEKKELRFQAATIKALQEGAEYYLIGMLEDAQLCAIHTKHKMVMPKDITLARRLFRDKVLRDDIESSTQYYAQTKPRGVYAK